MPRTPKLTTDDILANMHAIVKADRLIRYQYIDDKPDPERAASGALCRGHRACAIGSLWLAAGVEPRTRRFGDGSVYEVTLPGVDERDRADFLDDRPALRHALRALEAEAAAFAKRRGIARSRTWSSPLEDLWEDDRITRGDMLRIVSAARRRVRAA